MDDAPHTRPLAALAPVLLAALVVILCSMFTRDLWDPDEPRYMEVAREMFADHHYVVPHLNGAIYAEKPPVFFWLAGALWQAGLADKAGRVVAGLASIGTLLVTFALARRHLGLRAAGYAALVTLSVPLFTLNARQGVIDPLFTLWVTGAVALGFTAMQPDTRRRSACWLGAYALMGVGVLTKGPVGLIVPGLVLLAYRVLARPGGRARLGVHAAGAALFAVVVLAWLVPAILTGGEDYMRTILFRQTVGRAVASYSHRQPVYYYAVQMPAFWFPWTLLMGAAVVAALKWPGARERGPVMLGLAWLAAPVVFFTLISGKKTDYLLPAVPAIGILIAHYLTAGELEERPRWMRAHRWLAGLPLGALLVLSCGLLVATALAPAIMARLSLEVDVAVRASQALAPGRRALGAVLLAVPLVCSAIGLRRLSRPAATAWALAGCTLGLFVWFDLAVAPAANGFKSYKGLCERIRPLIEGKQLYFYRHDFEGGVNLYLGMSDIPVIYSERESKAESIAADEVTLRALLADPHNVVLSDEDRFVWVLDPDELAGMTLYSRIVGHRRMMLIQGPPPPRP